MLKRRTLFVDLSNNNADPIDWHTIKHAGVFGAMLKVSEGDNYVDPTFHQRAARARAAGLHVGGYHFARTNSAAAHQASTFATLLGKVGRRDLHPALDLETNDGALAPDELLAWAHDFAARVHRITGVRCLYYSGPGFYTPLRWQRPPGAGCGLWIAHYGTNDGTDQGVPNGATLPWHGYVAHQFTSVGRIAGVNGDVDLSHARSRRAMLAHGIRGLV